MSYQSVVQRLGRQWLQWRLTSERRADFYELLGNFISDGLPLFEALEEIDQQYRRSREPMHRVTETVLLRMRGQQGRAYTFGSALADFVPVVEALAIGSGEDAGDLANGLYRAALVCRSNGKISGTIREELAYPVFLVLLLAVLMVGISIYVIPMLASVLPIERWPLSAHLMANFAQATPWLLSATAIFLGAGLLFFLFSRSRWAMPMRAWFDRWVFPWTLHRRTTGAMLMVALATLMRTGVPFSRALEKLGEPAGAWERQHLQRMRGRLRRGQREGAALATDLFDDQVRWQIELYGRMTHFSEGLEKLASRTVAQTQAAIRRSFGILRVLLMVGIAAMIGWTYTAFLAITLAARNAA